MSEKMQHTAAKLREKMIQRYPDGFEHKHNKNHLLYRRHFRSHPCELKLEIVQGSFANSSTGLIREFKLRKMRKRLDKGRIH